MNNYLAKSNPIETIQEHTDNLLNNYEILKQIYPNLQVNWDILKVACLYHDLGKMNLKFQNKIEKVCKDEKEIAHNLLSLSFLDTQILKEKFSYEEIKIIAQAIAYHHNRGNYDVDHYEDEVNQMKHEAVNFTYDQLVITRVKKISKKYFSNQKTYSDDAQFFNYVLVKGLLNRIDYAASSNIDVETQNDFLIEALDRTGYDWNELQLFMRDNSDHNVVVVAQTGMGKTEAGLLWIGNNKGFFTLPLKTAINEIYNRITEGLVDTEHKKMVALLHSDTYSKYLENRNNDEEDIEDYFKKTKQLSLPLTICTLDQIFDFVFRYNGFEPKLATLAYSKVVIDEIQMYSSDLLAYLIYGLSFIDKIGGKFAILTATLPGIVTDLIKREGIEFEISDKPFIDNKIRHSVQIIDNEIQSDLIISKINHNRILVICNTVKKAQQIFEELYNNDELNEKKVSINLLHSKFIRRDRKNKESCIMKMGSGANHLEGIWIATQVVEASLDIDFDILITELSDINGLFQRLGRCYRKRVFNQDGYNCHVFNGGNKDCSGIGYVIDKDIFAFSKDELKGVDGRLSEQQKLNMIEKVYSTERLKDTEYYKKVIKNIDYLECINEFEKSNSEVKEIFRNIASTTVIPKDIYESNKDAINQLVEEINSVHTVDVKKFRENMQQKISELREFTVDIQSRELKRDYRSNRLKIGKYDEIIILDCTYTEQMGVQIDKNKKGYEDHFDARYF